MLRSPQRVPQLDGIRGIAILSVIIWHYSLMFPAAPKTVTAYTVRALSLTWSGVDLFFVLSGFLIGGILLDNRQSGNYFQVFYIRRFYRIVPLYVVCLAVSLIAKRTGYLDLVEIGDFIGLGWYLTFTQNIYAALHTTLKIGVGQTWSLAVEEQFYLLLPLLIRLFSRKRLLVLLALLVCAAPGIRCLIAAGFPIEASTLANYVLLPTRMDALFMGVLCAYAVRNEQTCQWLSDNTRTLYLSQMVLWGIVGVFLVKQWSINTLPMTIIGFTVIAFAYSGFLLIAVTETKGPIRWLTSLTPLRQVGIWAYCLYLFHGLVPVVVFGLAGKEIKITSKFGLLLLAITAALTFLMAHLSWRYFEAQIMKIGHQWKYLAISRPTPVLTHSSLSHHN